MSPLRKMSVGILVFFCFLNVHAQQQKLVFCTQWLPQAQFAGYYVAKDKGFYKQAGLDVEIIHPSATVNAVAFLKAGKADIISLFLTTGINHRQKGLDLVNIAQVSQHSAIMFVSLKKNGINELSKFNGKKIGIWLSGFDEVPKALVNKNQLGIEWVPIQSTVNLFMRGGIDIMTVMYYNEYDQVYLSGVNRDEINTFFMSDYGFDVPEDGLYVLRETSSSKKEALKAFVQATLRGWEYAALNKEYTINLVIRLMNEAQVPATRAHQKWMLDKILEMQDIKGKGVRPTELNPEDFRKAMDIMQNHYNAEFNFGYNDFFQPALSLKPR